VKELLGVGKTVTKAVAVEEMQEGVPGFVTLKVRVLTPVVFQLKLCGPCNEGSPPAQPSQVQLYTAPGKAVPLKETLDTAKLTLGIWQI
jgi:hypothetical protein